MMMNTKEIFEDARAALLSGKPIGKTLWVELATHGVVAVPYTGMPIATTQERENTLLRIGRTVGQRHPGDAVLSLCLVQIVRITKAVPRTGARRRYDALAAASICIGEDGSRHYSMQHAEILQSARGKVTALVGDLRPALVQSDATLDAALLGLQAAGYDEPQFKALAATLASKAPGRLSDAWAMTLEGVNQ